MSKDKKTIKGGKSDLKTIRALLRNFPRRDPSLKTLLRNFRRRDLLTKALLRIFRRKNLFILPCPPLCKGSLGSIYTRVPPL